MRVVRIRSSGFTLVELIIIMMMISILAVAAISRFSGTAVFDNRGFNDETLAALRYAQKTAIAQRRNVCVTFTSTTVSLSIAAVAGSTASCSPGTALANPAGSGAFVVTARNSASFSLTPTNFQFDALGRPRNAADQFIASQVIQFTGESRTITVVQETGYVHS